MGIKQMKITKTNFILLMIFLLAFVLRIIAAYHTDVGTDEMIYSIIPLNIISAQRLGTIEQSPLFFYLTDLGYMISGGITSVSVRLTAIVFGSLAVLVVYLLSKELFSSTKAALMSSFLFAVSGYALTYNTEMDMAAYFFALLSSFFFIRALKGSHHNYYLTALFLSLAILMKNIIILFALAFFVVWIFHEYKKKSFLKVSDEKKVSVDKKMAKIILVSVFLIALLLSPVLIYNYFTYKETGITDYYFSVVLGIGETAHQGMEAKPWTFTRLGEISRGLAGKFLALDGVLFVTGMLGFFLLFRKHKYEAWTLLLPLIFIYLYVAGQTGSSSHYVLVPLVLSIFAGPALEILAEKVRQQFSFKYFSNIVIIFVLIMTVMAVQNIIQERDLSITLSLRDYVHENIPEDAVVVIDPRIYRGIHAWVFNDKHYVDGMQFAEITNNLEKIPGEAKTVPLYYIECDKGSNCGWKPEDFQRIYNTGEEISAYFRENTQKIHAIQATHNFNIYQGSLTVPTGVYDIIDQTHVFWFYPVGWKYPEKAVDTYTPQGFGTVLNGFGFLMMYLDVLFAILAIPFVFYVALKKG